MESMRSVLKKSLGRSLATMPELDRLAAAWPVACGKAMAARGEIIAFEEGAVTVRVDDPAWLDQMRSMQGALQHELARIAQVRLTGIHFESRAATPRAAKFVTPGRKPKTEKRNTR